MLKNSTVVHQMKENLYKILIAQVLLLEKYCLKRGWLNFKGVSFASGKYFHNALCNL